MALHGSMTVLKAKHTWGFNLGDRINNGLQKWEKDVAIFRQKILNLSERNISDHEAQALLAKSLYDGHHHVSDIQSCIRFVFRTGGQNAGGVSGFSSSNGVGFA
jgi:hypothetical protein